MKRHIKARVYKVPYPLRGGVYQVWWEECQVVKRRRAYHGFEKEYKQGKKERGVQQYHLKTVGRNIKWVRMEEDGHFWEESQVKSRGGEEYKVAGNFIQPCIKVKHEGFRNKCDECSYETTKASALSDHIQV